MTERKVAIITGATGGIGGGGGSGEVTDRLLIARRWTGVMGVINVSGCVWKCTALKWHTLISTTVRYILLCMHAAAVLTS